MAVSQTVSDAICLSVRLVLTMRSRYSHRLGPHVLHHPCRQHSNDNTLSVYVYMFQPW